MRTETAQAGVSCRAVQREGSLLYGVPLQLQGRITYWASPPLCQQIEGLLGIPAWFPIKSRYSLSDTSLFRCQRIAGSSRFPGTKQQQAPQLHALVRLFSPYFKAECPPSRAVLSFLCVDRFYRSTSCFCTSTRFSTYSIISNDINIPVRGKYREWNSDRRLSFSFPGIKMHTLYFISSLLSVNGQKEVHRFCDYWSHNPASLLPFLLGFFGVSISLAQLCVWKNMVPEEHRNICWAAKYQSLKRHRKMLREQQLWGFSRVFDSEFLLHSRVLQQPKQFVTWAPHKINS